MAGIPYWTFDIGAFVLGSYDGVFDRGIKEPAYQELYTRMFPVWVPSVPVSAPTAPKARARSGNSANSPMPWWKADQWRYPPDAVHLFPGLAGHEQRANPSWRGPAHGIFPRM